jgi:hypothetical protein
MSGSIRRWVVRHPVAAFLVMVYGVNIAVALPSNLTRRDLLPFGFAPYDLLGHIVGLLSLPSLWWQQSTVGTAYGTWPAEPCGGGSRSAGICLLSFSYRSHLCWPLPPWWARLRWRRWGTKGRCC